MDPSILKKDKRFAFIMLCGIAWGIFAHGMALFKKISYHDDVPWFNGVGETYGLGRWALGASGTLTEKLFFSRNYSLPLFNGILTLAAIALMVYIICLKMRINDKLLIVGLTGVMICFPAVTNIFAYVFTAPYYYIGALLGVVGAYIFDKYRNIPSFIICTLLMALSTGMYQSNICINLMILLLFMLENVYTSDMKWKDYFFLALKNAFVCAAFMAEYFLINGIFLKVKDQDMYDYKGVSTFGSTDVRGYLWRVFTAYKRFIKPADFINYNGVSANMFPWNLKYLHMLLVLAVLILSAVIMRYIKDMNKIIQIGLIIIISPLFSYFFYVMVAEEDAHGGMAYGEVFMFALAAYIIERIRDLGKSEADIGVVYRRISLVGATACSVIIVIMAVMFARFANVCYLKAELMQQEAISYYTTLITRIEQTPGYTHDTPVAYIEPRSKNDDDFSGNRLFDPIYLPPFQNNSIINDFSWEKTMNMWCGFSRVEGEVPEGGAAEVAGMPAYPADGSIKMIDGVIVVKFAD